MARNKALQTNIDNSNLALYPNARIKDNDGSDNGTPVNESVYGDIHETFAKLMRLYGMAYNNLPDNETTGYQYIAALRALATKNDFVLNIDATSGKLKVGIKLGSMLVDEQVVCRASITKTTETQIVGSDGISRAVTFVGTFVNGDYVRLINTASTVILVRLVDATNLNTAVGELDYLKAASYLEEIAGLLDTVATTPQVNALAFVERVNGTLSAASLASANRNGLYPKEHWAIVDGLSSGGTGNKYGAVFHGDVDTGSVGNSKPVSGDISSAIIGQRTGSGEVVNVTLSSAMLNTDYLVRIHIQSLGTMQFDNDVRPIPFKIISSTQFQYFIEETGSVIQNLKFHFEVIQK